MFASSGQANASLFYRLAGASLSNGLIINGIGLLSCDNSLLIRQYLARSEPARFRSVKAALTGGIDPITGMLLFKFAHPLYLGGVYNGVELAELTRKQVVSWYPIVPMSHVCESGSTLFISFEVTYLQSTAQENVEICSISQSENEPLFLRYLAMDLICRMAMAAGETLTDQYGLKRAIDGCLPPTS